MNATTGAVGAFMLMFGFLFLIILGGVVQVLFPYGDPVGQLEVALAAVIVASAGAGLLFHGILSKKTEAMDVTEPEPEETN